MALAVAGAFLDSPSDGDEEQIRTTVSLGSDCDTLAAIAGSMAEGFAVYRKHAKGMPSQTLRS